MAYRRLPRRLAGLFRSPADIEAEVDEEIGFHLEMRTESLLRAGLPRAAARDQAEREFGDADSLRRELRRRDSGRERRRRLATWLEELGQDVRFGARSLVRTPTFTVVALATLALGIGASTAMFAVLDAVVLRPLPYGEADRLVRVWPGRIFNQSLVAEMEAGAPSLASVTGVSVQGLTLSGDGEAVRLAVQGVDAAFFDVFRVEPALGRRFGREARDPGRSDVVVLSHELWQTRFGGEAGVIGRRVRLDGYGHVAREVVGVMPRGFLAPPVDGVTSIDAWIPMHVGAGHTVATDSTWYISTVIGRLKPGATVEGLAAEVRTTARRVRAETGGIIAEESVQQAGAAGLLDALVGNTRRDLWLLLGAVGLVLLLACANLANLLLARGERRRSELAARAALGGTRARLVRGLLTESGLLALGGALAGVLLARLVLGVLRVAEASGLPRMPELRLDVRVAGFAIGVAALSLLLFALLPALRATSGDLRPALGSARSTVGRTRAGRRLGAILIGTEVALAMVLVTGAALLVQSFRTVRSVDHGYRTDGVLAVEIAPAPAEYEGERARVFYDRLLHELRGLPGVRSAGAIQLLPFTWSNWGFPYLAEGHAPPPNSPLPTANFRVTTPGYFDAVGVPVQSGRGFDATDAGGPPVGLINRTLAEQLWPGEDPVGREILLFGNSPFRVVGVVGDVRQHALDAEPQPELYRPFAQWPVSGMVIMLATDGDAATWLPAFRRVLASIDPNVPIVRASRLDDVIGESLAQRRFFARVLSFFGLLALTLGAVGVYGVMAYAVSARIPEFSVRLALGATQGEILADALRSALRPVLAGLVAGTAASLAATRLLEALLFGVQPRDPVVFAVALAVLGGVALLAGWLPARQVRRVEPMRALQAG